VDDVRYRLEVYYSEITEENQHKMVVEGDRDQYVDGLSRIPLTNGSYSEMKKFLQNVESMNLEIDNVVTYISVDDEG